MRLNSKIFSVFVLVIVVLSACSRIELPYNRTNIYNASTEFGVCNNTKCLISYHSGNGNTSSVGSVSKGGSLVLFRKNVTYKSWTSTDSSGILTYCKNNGTCIVLTNVSNNKINITYNFYVTHDDFSSINKYKFTFALPNIDYAQPLKLTCSIVFCLISTTFSILNFSLLTHNLTVVQTLNPVAPQEFPNNISCNFNGYCFLLYSQFKTGSKYFSLVVKSYTPNRVIEMLNIYTKLKVAYESYSSLGNTFQCSNILCAIYVPSGVSSSFNLFVVSIGRKFKLMSKIIIFSDTLPISGFFNPQISCNNNNCYAYVPIDPTGNKALIFQIFSKEANSSINASKISYTTGTVYIPDFTCSLDKCLIIEGSNSITSADQNAYSSYYLSINTRSIKTL